MMIPVNQNGPAKSSTWLPARPPAAHSALCQRSSPSATARTMKPAASIAQRSNPSMPPSSRTKRMRWNNTHPSPIASGYMSTATRCLRTTSSATSRVEKSITNHCAAIHWSERSSASPERGSGHRPAMVSIAHTTIGVTAIASTTATPDACGNWWRCIQTAAATSTAA